MIEAAWTAAWVAGPVVLVLLYRATRPRRPRWEFVRNLDDPDPTCHRTPPYPKVGHFNGVKR